MKDAISVSTSIAGKALTLEAGLLAQQAAGSAIAQLNETAVFSAVTCTTEPREGIDYFPLQVEYREKFYAAGKFPGGYFKRETKPSEKEILTARLTDRPLRPLFPHSYRNDVQVNNMLLSADGENEGDVLSVIAASTALTLSDIPFLGPIGAVRIGKINGKFIINPTHSEREISELDMVYACTKDFPLMIEGSANEISENDMIAAMREAHAEAVKIIDLQLELRRKLGLPEKVITIPEEDLSILNAAREICSTELQEACLIKGKQERAEAINKIKDELQPKLLEKFPEMTEEQFRSTFDELEIECVRKNIFEKNLRPDGRTFEEIRPLYAQVGILPRVHGSALFARGETQAMGTVTLGTKADIQSLDSITGGNDEKKFMFHYNFPPYSVGEVGKIGSTGRREIGHGALAERSLLPVIPKDYPYTIRIVSDIMGSNGSTSMASVCVGTLALMDAGIPIKKPVAGISIGLFTKEEKSILVTDILGTEDHCGDMDFKVAGTREGITGFQVDLKIRGLPWELVAKAFEEARKARLQILDFMERIISEPRPYLSPYAPRIKTIKIPVDKIGELIGPGGKNIKRITELSGAQIDIDNDGNVNIYATDSQSMQIALNEVSIIAAVPEEGKIYDGVVTGIKDFGAFVEILPGKEGLVHISELSDKHIRNVEEVCKIGDHMWVKCIGIDERGRIKLSRKEAMREKDS